MQTHCKKCNFTYQHENLREVRCIECAGLLRSSSGLEALHLRVIILDILGKEDVANKLLSRSILRLYVDIMTRPEGMVSIESVIDDLSCLGVVLKSGVWRYTKSMELGSEEGKSGSYKVPVRREVNTCT